MQVDLEGHYVGPSSGISLLLPTQKPPDRNQRHAISLPDGCSLFTFSDSPLPGVDMADIVDVDHVDHVTDFQTNLDSVFTFHLG